MKKYHKMILLIGILGALIFAGCSSADTAVLTDNVSVNVAYEAYQDGVLMLDVRTLEEWNQHHIPGATMIEMNEIPARLSEIPTDQPVIIYCRTGNRSSQVLAYLQDQGFTNLSNMQGGINQWMSQGYEIE